MRIALLAHRRFPIAVPFAGGLESFTWHLARSLRERNIGVTVFAAPGSDPSLGLEELMFPPVDLSEDARRDSAMPAESHVQETFAYMQVMQALARRTDVDVVHNNSLHYLPIMLGATLDVPLLTSLHTPPTPWLEPALRLCSDSSTTTAVSHAMARQWEGIATPRVIRNGIDVRDWPMGAGGDDLVWSGRIVPEKAPHLAALIARRAGRRLRIAGPLSDPEYFHNILEPMLGDDIEWVGHLLPAELATLIGSSAACLVTPEWDEPFGLVAVEAMACGTPVLALGRGGLREIARAPGGVWTEVHATLEETVEAAVEGLRLAETYDRRGARAYVEENFSLTEAVEKYLALYEELRAS